jgi:hypothetical protein
MKSFFFCSIQHMLFRFPGGLAYSHWTSRVVAIFALTLFAQGSSAQNSVAFSPQQVDHAPFVRSVFEHALLDSRSYPWLESLCYSVGHRLSGSAGAEKAVRWAKSVMDTMGLDSVWLQPVMVPHWERGAPELVRLNRRGGPINLPALALGGSVPTPEKGIQADVVEVRSWDSLDILGQAGVLRGKIVFFNRPMASTHIHTFRAYGGAVDQRVQGPSRAAQYGAVAVLVRSMGFKIDDFPHTGTLVYDSAHAFIPAAAISTRAAEQLQEVLRMEGRASVFIKLNCRTLPDVLSYNVIGEIRGAERPEEIIVVGGHLDSWDVGHGAHDDGAGCVQSMDVLHLLKHQGYTPRRTIRCVLFMNEENGLRGGLEYARVASQFMEEHVFALESDAGGFAPRGFSFDAVPDALDARFQRAKSFAHLLEPYGVHEWTTGGSGADIGPLKPLGGLLCGYRPDSQRYFDYHHSAADVFEAVNKRELELGAAAMTALVYLMDQE